MNAFVRRVALKVFVGLPVVAGTVTVVLSRLNDGIVTSELAGLEQARLEERQLALRPEEVDAWHARQKKRLALWRERDMFHRAFVSPPYVNYMLLCHVEQRPSRLSSA